ncbi:hypothetical protein Syun_020624 [Stephania yunnanensis]|uniref:Uncharacterized protein n=1 Tax=Stephania yunnanensis TaxID=152371 RepID=A0AAP0NNE2_9MAGN
MPTATLSITDTAFDHPSSPHLSFSVRSGQESLPDQATLIPPLSARSDCERGGERWSEDGMQPDHPLTVERLRNREGCSGGDWKAVVLRMGAKGSRRKWMMTAVSPVVGGRSGVDDDIGHAGGGKC